MDEPTVGLDPEERIRFRKLMANLGRDRTILLSTHIVADLGAACREIALLDRGQIIFQGSPAQLVAEAVGQVFEVSASESDLDAYEHDYDIVSTRVADGRMTLRGVAADNHLPPAATAVPEPTLEESYMAFMAAEGRSSGALQDEEQRVDAVRIKEGE